MLFETKRFWKCPNCEATHVTNYEVPHTPMHLCPSVGVIAPYVMVNVTTNLRSYRHRVIYREDYINGEQGLVYQDGKPVMAVQTEREDGYDTIVFPGTATVRTE